MTVRLSGRNRSARFLYNVYLLGPNKLTLEEHETKFEATASSGDVSAILLCPIEAEWLYVLAHGAGAGMSHPFMETFAVLLAESGIATFRYQFPYIEQGRRAPNPQPILKKTVWAAVAAAVEAAPGLRLIAGGKSMGGRMTSLAASEAALERVEGLAFLGFPLHAPGRDSADRGAHLADVDLPMLFLQGTRDKLANLDLLRPLVDDLGGRAKIHALDSGDHSFKPLKSSGRTHDEVLIEAVSVLSGWLTDLSRL